MSELTAAQQRYLLAAFVAVPQDWFRPRILGHELAFADIEIDKTVAALAHAGLMDAQPERHARLTPQGRKTATHLRNLAAKDAARTRRPVALAGWITGSAIFLAVLAILWWTGII